MRSGFFPLRAFRGPDGGSASTGATPKPADAATDCETGAPLVAFGKRRVRADTKAGLVRDLFGNVSGYYDRMNDVLSFGMHRVWKRQALWWLPPGGDLLDLAGGTGDLAFAYRKRERTNGRTQGSATVADLTEGMIERGKARRGAQDIDWVVAAAEALPFPDNRFDHCACAFGFRNMTDRDKALREALRVLRPGGTLVTLEFSQTRLPGLRQAYAVYRDRGLATLGRLIARDGDSYQYLGDSIAAFPDAEDWAQALRSAGFEGVSFRRLAGGIVALHRGFKPPASRKPDGTNGITKKGSTEKESTGKGGESTAGRKARSA